jgi:hypothetical protein
MPVDSQAALEIARFIASHPSPEQVIAFQASPEVVARAYALVEAERSRALTDDEHQEMDSLLTIQHIMILAKAEAHRQIQQQAS